MVQTHLKERRFVSNYSQYILAALLSVSRKLDKAYLLQNLKIFSYLLQNSINLFGLENPLKIC